MASKLSTRSQEPGRNHLKANKIVLDTPNKECYTDDVLYATTLPPNLDECFIPESVPIFDKSSLESDSVRGKSPQQFTVRFEIPSSVDLEEGNPTYSLLEEPQTQISHSSSTTSNGNLNSKNHSISGISNGNLRSKKFLPRSGATNGDIIFQKTTSQLETRTFRKPAGKFEKIDNSTNIIDKKHKKAIKTEIYLCLLHTLVSILCIVMVSLMARLIHSWEVKIRRCPMYVKVYQNDAVFWGNENLDSCHYVAYMPVLILIISISMMVFHGGIIYSWNHGYKTEKLLLSKKTFKWLFLVEFIELIFIFSVCGIVVDGVRQTCLGFWLNPFENERPQNCKSGFKERDEVYGIKKTYGYLMTVIVMSSIAVFFLLVSNILVFKRIRGSPRSN